MENIKQAHLAIIAVDKNFDKSLMYADERLKLHLFLTIVYAFMDFD